MDVAYHIGSVFEPAERAANERDLLEHYLGRLASAGTEPPAFEEAWEDYRTALVVRLFHVGDHPPGGGENDRPVQPAARDGGGRTPKSRAPAGLMPTDVSLQVVRTTGSFHPGGLRRRS